MSIGEITPTCIWCFYSGGDTYMMSLLWLEGSIPVSPSRLPFCVYNASRHENNVTKIVSDCIYSPELLAKNGSLNYCISCNFFNNHFSLQNFNAPKFYPVSFAIRNFLNHKYDWCKSKKMHILPIFANFVTNAKKTLCIYMTNKITDFLQFVLWKCILGIKELTSWVK